MTAPIAPAPGTFYDTSANPAVAASDVARVAAYNKHYEEASGALSDIYVAGQGNLAAGMTRMEQVAQVLRHLATHGQTSAAQDNFLQGKPIALSSGSAPAALGTPESNFVDWTKGKFGGNLDNARTFIENTAGALQTAQEQINALAEKLRQETEAHTKTKKTVTVDPTLVKERDTLKADKARLQTELAAEKAKKTPAPVPADVADAISQTLASIAQGVDKTPMVPGVAYKFDPKKVGNKDDADAIEAIVKKRK